MEILLQLLEFFNLDPYALNVAMQSGKASNLIDASALTALEGLEDEISKYTSDFVNDAKSLAAIFMLIFFSLKSYGIMTGDEKLEIMPLLRPFAILLVIALWIPFTNFIAFPIGTMEDQVKESYTNSIALINAEEVKRKDLINQALAVYNKADAEVNWADRLLTLGDLATGGLLLDADDPNSFGNIMAKKLKILYARFGMMVYEYLEMFVLFIFRAAFYIIFYLKIMFSTMLIIIGPLSFAVSILAGFKDAYIKWISKFISVLLYGFFGYLAGLMALAHVLYGIRQEVKYWESFDFNSGQDEILAALVQNTNGQYWFIVTLIVGIAGFFCVPFISHWVVGSGSTGQLASKASGGAKSAVKGMQSAGGAVISGAKKLAGR